MTHILIFILFFGILSLIFAPVLTEENRHISNQKLFGFFLTGATLGTLVFFAINKSPVNTTPCPEGNVFVRVKNPDTAQKSPSHIEGCVPVDRVDTFSINDITPVEE